jgi:sec-independent protein translocase protein TatC
METKNPDRERVMSLGEHLEELRQRIFKSLYILCIFMGVTLYYGKEIHVYFTQPYKNVLGQNATFYQIQLMAPFVIYLKTSFMLSILISIPFLLYLIWGFVSPAVSEQIDRLGKALVLLSTLLFWAGIYLCWATVFENFLEIFLVILRPEGINPSLPIDEYYDIFFNLHLIFGLSFQLPVVLILLSIIGIIHSNLLIEKWREIVLGLAVFSAVLSPGPDVISMLFLLIPLLVLFLLSIILIKFIERDNNDSIPKSSS